MAITNPYTPEALQELRMAYHKIITGQHVKIVIDQNGERIEFQSANVTALAELIRKIELALSGQAATSPLRVIF